LGIFYALGVKTNVLFFTRGKTEHANTDKVWIYDLRTNMPHFRKRTPLTRERFRPFEHAYGSKAAGTARRYEDERFRCFSREEIRLREDSIDIVWLTEANAMNAGPQRSPDVIVDEVLTRLRDVLREFGALQRESKKKN